MYWRAVCGESRTHGSERAVEGQPSMATLRFRYHIRCRSLHMAQNFKDNTLYEMDNLVVLRGMNSETVDLIEVHTLI